MILRRVMEHVKAQSWTAVVLDFVIVVMGVFVGLQVSNWNAARLARLSAAEFHERLLSDLGLEVQNYNYLQNYYRDVRAAAETTYAGLTGKIEISDADLLVSAFRASQYNIYERYRATFDELVSSGNLDLIEDAQLRSNASGYYGLSFLEDIAQQSQRSEYRVAFRKTMSPELHRALARQCGDKPIEGAPIGLVSFNYECKLDWPAVEVAAGAARLRADETLSPLLRLRIADLDSLDFTLNVNREQFGLDAYAQDGDVE